MTDRELLERVLDTVIDVKKDVSEINERLDRVEERLDRLEKRMDGLEERVGALEERVGTLEDRIGNLEGRVGTLEKRMDNYDKELMNTKLVLEGVVDRCVQVLGEGYQGVNEKIDNMKINSMKAKIDKLELMYTSHEILLQQIQAS